MGWVALDCVGLGWVGVGWGGVRQHGWVRGWGGWVGGWVGVWSTRTNVYSKTKRATRLPAALYGVTKHQGPQSHSPFELRE